MEARGRTVFVHWGAKEPNVRGTSASMRIVWEQKKRVERKKKGHRGTGLLPLHSTEHQAGKPHSSLSQRFLCTKDRGPGLERGRLGEKEKKFEPRGKEKRRKPRTYVENQKNIMLCVSKQTTGRKEGGAGGRGINEDGAPKRIRIRYPRAKNQERKK